MTNIVAIFIAILFFIHLIPLARMIASLLFRLAIPPRDEGGQGRARGWSAGVGGSGRRGDEK
eukprot:971244-Pyramimonas_sp.AAC.1